MPSLRRTLGRDPAATKLVSCWRTHTNIIDFNLNILNIGNIRKIEIPDCVQFNISTNACRGYCESYAVPSTTSMAIGGLLRPPKPVTSVGQCCNIMESEDVKVALNCLDGPRILTFKSATKCSCYHCKKN